LGETGLREKRDGVNWPRSKSLMPKGNRASIREDDVTGRVSSLKDVGGKGFANPGRGGVVALCIEQAPEQTFQKDSGDGKIGRGK